MFDCNGGIYTQTTDVEGEVNGFLTYDRAVDHVDDGGRILPTRAVVEWRGKGEMVAGIEDVKPVS